MSRALQGGAAPVLQHLLIRGYDFNYGCSDDVWYAIADMVEARASLPGCTRFESFDVNCWLDKAPLEEMIRIMRALLPSIKELREFEWNAAFEACFLEGKKKRRF